MGLKTSVLLELLASTCDCWAVIFRHRAGKSDMPVAVENQVKAMKIGAQRLLVLDPEVMT